MYGLGVWIKDLANVRAHVPSVHTHLFLDNVDVHACTSVCVYMYTHTQTHTYPPPPPERQRVRERGI